MSIWFINLLFVVWWFICNVSGFICLYFKAHGSRGILCKRKSSAQVRPGFLNYFRHNTTCIRVAWNNYLYQNLLKYWHHCIFQFSGQQNTFILVNIYSTQKKKTNKLCHRQYIPRRSVLVCRKSQVVICFIKKIEKIRW